MAKQKLTKKEELKLKVDQTNSKFEAFMKSNKEHHYNFEDTVDYCISTGSMTLDTDLVGFEPGLHRFIGVNEGGKTSQALQVVYEGLKSVPNTKAVFIKAEGRLSEAMKKRSGIKFSDSKDIKKWKKGECFVFETNIFETALDFVSMLIDPTNNPENIRYLIILDSVDGLIPKGDLEKSLSDAPKIAGGAVISSAWCKKQSIALGKRGHMMIMISQVRAKVDIDGGRGAPSVEPTRQISSTGGNALMHYANYIWEFLPRWGGDLILEDPDSKPDFRTNKIIGHYARIKVKKSPTEKSNNVYTYPILYGRTGGKSIWKEKEIVDLMMPWEMITKAGSWFTFSDQFFAVAESAILFNEDERFKEKTKEEIAELPKIDQPFPPKVQGLNKVFDEIEARPELVDALCDYFTEMIRG